MYQRGSVGLDRLSALARESQTAPCELHLLAGLCRPICRLWMQPALRGLTQARRINVGEHGRQPCGDDGQHACGCEMNGEFPGQLHGVPHVCCRPRLDWQACRAPLGQTDCVAGDHKRAATAWEPRAYDGPLLGELKNDTLASGKDFWGEDALQPVRLVLLLLTGSREGENDFLEFPSVEEAIVYGRELFGSSRLQLDAIEDLSGRPLIAYDYLNDLCRPGRPTIRDLVLRRERRRILAHVAFKG